MPWVDPDALLIPECLDIFCDKCNKREHYKEGEAIASFWRNDIFKGMHKPECCHMLFCKECAILMTPYVYKLFDILVLKTSVNKLKQAIYDRTKNNRTITANVS